MPQISLYIDEETLKKVEIAAKRSHVSLSRWVADQIRARMEPVYPLGFEDLYGSLAEDPLTRPDQGTLSQDSPREEL